MLSRTMSSGFAALRQNETFAYGAPPVNKFWCRWYRLWSCRDLIMEAPCYMASQDISWTMDAAIYVEFHAWTVYSQCLSPQRD